MLNIYEATGIEYSRKSGLGKTRDIALCLSASDWRGLNRNQMQTAVIEPIVIQAKGSDKLTNTNELFEGKPFNYVSLFSGIGGFEQALNRLGGSCVMASEIDKYANQAYEVLYGHSTVGDVTKVAAEDVPDHDLLAFGFPCQAFSVAGKRLGFEEARGTLFFEAARIAKAKQPKVLLAENVKGLVSHDKGKTLDTIIQTLDEIGYTVDFEVMNSKYFGVPQNRERIFIVAVRNDLIEPSDWNVGKRSDVVAKGKKRIAQLGVKTFNFDWPEQTEVTVRLRDILESDVDEKFYLSEEKTAKLVAQLEEKDKVVGSVGHHPFSKKFEFSGYNSEISPTLLATDYKAPKTLLEGHREPKYRIRKLTVSECFALQGFPDDVWQRLSAAGISNSQGYKQAGNAVTCNVISALGRRLITYLGGE